MRLLQRRLCTGLSGGSRRGLTLLLAGVAALLHLSLSAGVSLPGAPGPQDPFVLGAPKSMGPPAVAVDDQGFSHIVYTIDNQVFYHKVSEQLRYAEGWDLADPGLPGADPASPPEPGLLVVYEGLPALQAKVVADHAGNAHIVVWSQGRALSGLVYIMVGADGAKRTHQRLRMKPLPSGDVQYSWPGIAIDPVTDLPVVIGIAQVTNETPASLEFAYVSPGLGMLAFLSLYPIYTPAFTTCSEYVVALRLGPAGEVTSQHVFWSERQNGVLPYRSEAPAVAVDLDGDLHAVWRHRLEGPDSYIAYRNSTQSGSGLASLYSLSAHTSFATASPAARPAIVRDPDGDLHVVWHTVGSGCAYVCLNPGGEIVSETSPGSREALVTGPPALAVGADRLVRVVWQDGRHGEDEIYYAAIGRDTGQPLKLPDAAGADDCRLSFSKGSAFAPAIGVSPWGQPSIVWKDTGYRLSGTEPVRYSLAKYRPPWTWLLYINGDNELAESCLAALSGASDDRDQFLGLEEVAYLPLVRLVVQYDGPGQDDTRRFLLGYDSSRSEDYATLANRYQAYLGRACWYVGPGGAGTDPADAEADMADPAALRSFLSWAHARYPGGHTLLSLIGPGSGWLPGSGAGARGEGGTRSILLDENGTPSNPDDDSSMGPKALRLALDNGGQPFHYDLLFLDASCSGLLEVAYQVRQYADFLLLSQGDSTPGPYGSYLAALANAAGASPDPDPDSDSDVEAAPVAPLDAAKAIVAQYHTSFTRAEESGLLRQHTLAALRSSCLDGLWESVDALVGSARGLRAFPELKQAQIAAWANSQRTDDEGRYTDLWSFCAQLAIALGDLPAAATLMELVQAVKDGIDRVDDNPLVVANAHDDRLMADCHGISIYFPFYRPDLAVGGTPEADEEDPGASVPLAEEEEESKGVPAIVNRRADIPVALRFPSGATTGTLRLERSNGYIGLARRDPATGALAAVFATATALVRTWDLSRSADRAYLKDLQGKLVGRGKTAGVCLLTMTYTGSAADSFTDRVKCLVVDVNCLVDSNNDGRPTRDDDRIEEDAPGLILPWNNNSSDGDENGNGKIDADEIDRTNAKLDGEADKADLADLLLHLGPKNIPKTAHIELVVSDPALVRVFDESYTAILGASVPGKTGPVASWESTLVRLSLPDRNATFHLEGVKPGVLDLSFRLKDKQGKVVAQDKLKITVLGLDLLVDSDNSGTPEDADDPNEEASPGKIIPVNEDNDLRDDDNGDRKVDNSDNDTLDLEIDGANDEADMAVLILRVPSTGLPAAHMIELEADDPTKVRVFNDAAPPVPVIGPGVLAGVGPVATWQDRVDSFAAPSFSRRFLVEGINSGEVTLKLTYVTSAGHKLATDKAKLSVVRVEFAKAAPEGDTGNRYGFDDWDSPPAYGLAEVSVEKNLSTKVRVTFDGLGKAEYLHFRSRDPTIADVGALPAPAPLAGFDLTINGKAKRKDTVVIEARGGTATGTVCNTLWVRVFAKQELAKLNVYRVTDSTSPGTQNLSALTRDAVKAFCNGIAKQAVVNFAAVDVDDKDIPYDVSPKNGAMDFYYDGGDQPELSVVTNLRLPGDPKAAIFKHVNFAWRVSAEALAGQKKVQMKGVDYINDWRADTFQLGSGATLEAVNIQSVNGTELTLVANLQFTHAVDEVLYKGGGGASTDPQVVVDGPEVTNTIMHECLHRRNVADLLDLWDERNTMCYYTGLHHDQLRSLPLPKRYEAGTEQQWWKVPRPVLPP